jgi:hypothetical protein
MLYLDKRRCLCHRKAPAIMTTSPKPPRIPPKSAPIFSPDSLLSPTVSMVLVSVALDALVIAVLPFGIPLELAAGNVPLWMYKRSRVIGVVLSVPRKVTMSVCRPFSTSGVVKKTWLYTDSVAPSGRPTRLKSTGLPLSME